MYAMGGMCDMWCMRGMVQRYINKGCINSTRTATISRYIKLSNWRLCGRSIALDRSNVARTNNTNNARISSHRHRPKGTRPALKTVWGNKGWDQAKCPPLWFVSSTDGQDHSCPPLWCVSTTDGQDHATLDHTKFSKRPTPAPAYLPLGAEETLR